MHYVEHGAGTPVLALRGVDVDHREVQGGLEPLFADRRATFAVLDRAGHVLLHEQVELVTALLADWLDRVREHHDA